MIKISESFKTDNKRLSALYEGAKSSLLGAVHEFGEYRLMGAHSSNDELSLISGIMSAETLGRYDVVAALDTVSVFAHAVNEEGRLPSKIIKNKEGLSADYSVLCGLSFVEEALSLFYMTKKKELSYLDMIYDMYKKLDKYIWTAHDLNLNGFAEIFGKNECMSEELYGKYRDIFLLDSDGERSLSPFPVESALFNAFAYCLKAAIARISHLMGDGMGEEYEEDARSLKVRFKERFWRQDLSACYDRDYRGKFIEVLTLENLYMMYYGVFDDEMADAFVSKHLLSQDEFYTRLPLPMIPQNHCDDCSETENLVRADSYRRAVVALERYGYYRELNELSQRLLDAVYESMAFTELYDSLTGEPIKKAFCADHSSAASAVLEIISRLYGITVSFDNVYWGTTCHEDETGSECRYKWGGELYRLFCEQDTCSAFIGENRIFTVTEGVRVITDWFGNSPTVINISGEEIDCVFVYRSRTFSFTLMPDEIKVIE